MAPTPEAWQALPASPAARGTGRGVQQVVSHVGSIPLAQKAVIQYFS